MISRPARRAKSQRTRHQDTVDRARREHTVIRPTSDHHLVSVNFVTYYLHLEAKFATVATSSCESKVYQTKTYKVHLVTISIRVGAMGDWPAVDAKHAMHQCLPAVANASFSVYLTRRHPRDNA